MGVHRHKGIGGLADIFWEASARVLPFTSSRWYRLRPQIRLTVLIRKQCSIIARGWGLNPHWFRTTASPISMP
jgi:hypothetical protein